MKNQKGSVALLIVIVLAAAIIAGAAYWYGTQNSVQPSIATQQQVTTLPTAQPAASTKKQTTTNQQVEQKTTAPAMAEVIPSQIGQCVTTSVKAVYPYKSDMTTIYGGGHSAIVYQVKDPNVPVGTPTDFTFAYQVSNTDISGVDRSQVGDQVNLCLKSVPAGCPAGDTRGTVYSVTNLRTNQSWDAANSLGLCGNGH